MDVECPRPFHTVVEHLDGYFCVVKRSWRLFCFFFRRLFQVLGKTAGQRLLFFWFSLMFAGMKSLKCMAFRQLAVEAEFICSYFVTHILSDFIILLIQFPTVFLLHDMVLLSDDARSRDLGRSRLLVPRRRFASGLVPLLLFPFLLCRDGAGMFADSAFAGRWFVRSMDAVCVMDDHRLTKPFVWD